MALQAGRVGVAPDQVDIFGNIKLKDIVSAVKEELSDNFPLIDRKWYKVTVSCDGTDYTGSTDYPSGSLEFHTQLVLLPAGVVPKAFMSGVNQRVSGGSSSTYNQEGLQYGYTNTTATRCGFRLPAKTVVFNLVFWFCV